MACARARCKAQLEVNAERCQDTAVEQERNKRATVSSGVLGASEAQRLSRGTGEGKRRPCWGKQKSTCADPRDTGEACEPAAWGVKRKVEEGKARRKSHHWASDALGSVPPSTQP